MGKSYSFSVESYTPLLNFSAGFRRGATGNRQEGEGGATVNLHGGRAARDGRSAIRDGCPAFGHVRHESCPEARSRTAHGGGRSGHSVARADLLSTGETERLSAAVGNHS